MISLVLILCGEINENIMFIILLSKELIYKKIAVIQGFV